MAIILIILEYFFYFMCYNYVSDFIQGNLYLIVLFKISFKGVLVLLGKFLDQLNWL